MEISVPCEAENRRTTTDPQFAALCLKPQTEQPKGRANWWLGALSKNGYYLCQNGCPRTQQKTTTNGPPAHGLCLCERYHLSIPPDSVDLLFRKGNWKTKDCRYINCCSDKAAFFTPFPLMYLLLIENMKIRRTPTEWLKSWLLQL